MISTSTCGRAPMTRWDPCAPQSMKTKPRPIPRQKIPAWATRVEQRKQEAKRDSTMKTRAAIAFEAKKPLEIVELDLEGPKAGEVLVEIKATGICHTDAYTLDGFDSEGIFPSVL